MWCAALLACLMLEGKRNRVGGVKHALHLLLIEGRVVPGKHVALYSGVFVLSRLLDLVVVDGHCGV